MSKKEFSKFFIASLKRTAMNVAPLIRRKQKLQEEIQEKNEELSLIIAQMNTYEYPIKEVTGGYGIEDLVVKTVEFTGKMDKDGKPIKITKYGLKYPETVIPPVEESTEEIVGESVEETNNEPLNYN